MFDLKLFLGFAVDELFHKKLQEANPYLLSLFIGKEDYLKEISYQGKNYLGKYLPAFPTFDQLEDVEKHLHSLLSKLVPSYSFATNPPVVMTLCNNDK